MIELSRISQTDYDTLIGWAESPKLLFQWSGGSLKHPLNHEQLIGLLDASHNHRVPFKASLKEMPTMVGYCDLNIDTTHRSALIARVIVAPTHRGQGIGTAMIREVLKVGFEEYALHRIMLNVFDFNQQAISAYQRAGLVQEGTLRDAFRCEDEYWNAMVMSVLEDEWRATRHL